MSRHTLPAAEDAPRLRDPRHRVNRRAIGWWSLRAALGWLVVVGVQLVIRFTTGDGVAWLLTSALICVGVGIVHVMVMPQWRYRVHRWEITADAVYTLSGWANLEWRVAPVSRIQTVDTERRPLEQLFGLATVTVTTASAAGAVEINGIDHELAADLVEELTARTQDHRGDAT